ncbi:MAG: hypothetical protein P4L43_20920 [Syntrophobacteraceae bacterium]|nr:hypothetical protein [Syntrophobacteraceae bacterium]
MLAWAKRWLFRAFFADKRAVFPPRRVDAREDRNLLWTCFLAEAALFEDVLACLWDLWTEAFALRPDIFLPEEALWRPWDLRAKDFELREDFLREAPCVRDLFLE